MEPVTDVIWHSQGVTVFEPTYKAGALVGVALKSNDRIYRYSVLTTPNGYEITVLEYPSSRKSLWTGVTWHLALEVATAVNRH